MRPETAAISPATLALLTLDHRSHEPLQDQLLAALRKLILERALLPGQRVPSSRALAQQLGVSRNTVLAAFDQLQSEGYFAGTRGSGTYVAPTLPEQFLKVSANSPRSGAASAIATSAPRTVAKPGAQHEVSPATIAATGGAHFTWPARPFRPCVPSVAEFPIDVWESLRRRVLRRRGTRLLEYSVAHGDPALREQIAIYLRDYRGVRCEAEQIIVTAGAQQAFGLIARVMGGPGGGVWMEDPGYTDALSAFEAAGLTVHSLAIDPEGMVLPRTAKRGVSLAYMTPSRQFPLGVTMSLTRRMAWLNYAQQHGVWLIEDDYDSEYRYVGRPLPSLQGLAPETRVIYVGTFSKALYPSLRLGYVVAPANRVESFIDTRSIMDSHSPNIEQAVLAEFFREGHFVRHLRRMRGVYGERAEVFQEEAAREWAGLLDITPSVAGLNVTGYFPGGGSDLAFAAAARSIGYHVPPLSMYSRHEQIRPGLLFGFAAFAPGQIRKAIRELAGVWRKNIKPF